MDGEAKLERATLEQHFPTNYSMFDPSRATQAGKFGRLLINRRWLLLRTEVRNKEDISVVL